MNSATATAGTRSTSSGFSAFNFIPAIWMVISPYVLGFSNLTTATWNNVAAGIAIGIVTAACMGAYEKSGWSWVNALLGVWVIISPFVLGFATNTELMWNNIIVGAVVALVALTNALAHPATTTTQATDHTGTV